MTQLLGLPRDTLYDLGNETLGALTRYWPASPAAPLPDKRQFVSNGIVFWDEETVAVSFGRMYAVDGDVASEQWNQNPQLQRRAVIMEVTILRKVPDIVGEGTRATVPLPSEIQDSARDLYGDGIDVYNCVLTAHVRNELATVNGVAFQDWNLVGPEGGMAASVTNIRTLLL